MAPPVRPRLLLAGALTALALTGGAGAAYAATSGATPGTGTAGRGADPGPSGYAVVVDESPVLTAHADCPSTLPTTSGADA